MRAVTFEDVLYEIQTKRSFGELSDKSATLDLVMCRVQIAMITQLHSMPNMCAPQPWLIFVD